jgi:trimethylamine---corrinoid protein Co-methyltransferase
MIDYPDKIQLFTRAEMAQIHAASLDILANPGMRIESPSLRSALRSAGATVDDERRQVRFPAGLVEETLEQMQASIAAGKKQIVLNGVVTSLTPRSMCVKFGGGCIEYMDWKTGEVRTPTRADLVEMVQLGEALPEVTFVGNPVMYLSEDDGTKIEPHMQRVRTAALIARYTTKAGSTEVWNATELKYLMMLGEIVRGSRAAYLERPCFVTAKETISPLVLDQAAGDVLLLLAHNDLPCVIIPMPITGTSSPLSLAANIALGNAEIIGTFTAIHAANPGTNLVGGVISGTFNMRTTQAVFASPEAVLQDLGLAEIHERLYGFDFGAGGYIDGKYPGAQIMLEVFARFSALARSGRYNVPAGLLNSGKRFSPVQAMLDIEVERWIVEAGKGITVSEDTLLVEQIRRVGIAGHSLAEDHTLENMRKNIWYPQLMDHTSPGLDQEHVGDMVDAAARRVEKVLSQGGLYEADDDKIKAIDEVVRAAEKELQS